MEGFITDEIVLSLQGRVRRDRGPPRSAPQLWQIREICEECEAFSTQSCLNLQLCGDDAMPKREGSTSESDELSNVSRKHGRTNPPVLKCPWESFMAAPVLRSIPIESALSSPITAFPLLMVVKPWGKSCQLVNLFTSEQLELKHRVILPFCLNSFNMYTGKQQPHYSFYFRCFYSRKSWMLLWEKYPLCCCSNKPLLMVLLNPLTNQRIELPDIGQYDIRDAAFSVSATARYASPDCVIAIADRSEYSYDTCIHVAMWRPGWKTWEIHRAKDTYLSADLYCGMVFSGNRVYCFTQHGDMYVLCINGDKGCWGISRNINDSDLLLDGVESFCIEIFDGQKVLKTAGEYGSYNFALGKDGKEILKIISWNGKAGKRGYRFYRLDQQEMNWIRLDNDEWMGRSWFFTDEYVISTSVIGGSKMFRKSNVEYYRIKIISDDLENGSSHSLAGGERFPSLLQLAQAHLLWYNIVPECPTIDLQICIRALHFSPDHFPVY